MGRVSENSIQAMRDAGCSADSIARVVKLCACDYTEDAVRELRRQRAMLMDGLHEQQARIDCIDFVVRDMKKNI